MYFAEIIVKYTDINELDSDLLYMLIDKIAVHEKSEKYGISGDRIDPLQQLVYGRAARDP